MSNTALAHHAAAYPAALPLSPRTVTAPPRPTRRQRAPRAFHVPWQQVSMSAAAITQTPGRVPAYAWALAFGAIALHLGAFWYLNTHTVAEHKPAKREIAIEFVQPPKPVEQKKVEPPKPQPKQQPVQREAQVLPQIEQPVSTPSADTGAASEAPIAIAPIVSAPPAPPAELPVTAPFGKAGYLNNPLPDYPPMAARQGWEGTVTLRVRVLANGSVDTVEVQRSSGRKVLDDEAVRTVKKWSFSPSKRGDTPVDGWATVPLEFKLDQ